MKFGSNIEIIAHNNGTYTCIVNKTRIDESDRDKMNEARTLYKDCAKLTAAGRAIYIRDNASKYPTLLSTKITTEDGAVVSEFAIPEPAPAVVLEAAIKGIMDFFSEFDFEPNFRFLNTLSKALTVDTTTAKKYITSYFELIDSPYKNEVKSKIGSKEFVGILKDMAAIAPTKSVNNRFKLYYGSQGTGKTTIGQKESDGRCVVCNSSMLPADLMEDFVFDSGKPSFTPSILWDCMEQGKVIVLDEINLLPFDSLRFLQGILDGKKEFNYKGRTVHINDGFMIIGTMNLSVNGMIYGLPEPLVDRCMEMKKFRLTAGDLVSAII